MAKRITLNHYGKTQRSNDMEDNLTIDEMFHGLIDGKQYVLKDEMRLRWRSFNNGTLRYFTPGGSKEIHLEEYDTRDAIAYSCHGTSAVDVTKDDLEWLLKTIFKAEPSDFVEYNVHTVLDVINEGR